MAAGLSLGRVFDRSFWLMAGLTTVTGGLCLAFYGIEAMRGSFEGDLSMLLWRAPKLAIAFVVGGFVQVVLPRDKVARVIGERSGLKGIVIASAAGMVTPGGPMTSFPLVKALHLAGTGRGALVAYLTSWATLGFQRILIWELPLMGMDFVMLRVIASLPLPIAAGLISRAFPAHSAGLKGAAE